MGVALILSGAIVLYVLRRALWRRLDDEEPEAPPAERVHGVGPGDGPIDTPLDDREYGARPTYVPAERGTIYVSRTRSGRTEPPPSW